MKYIINKFSWFLLLNNNKNKIINKWYCHKIWCSMYCFHNTMDKYRCLITYLCHYLPLFNNKDDAFIEYLLKYNSD